MSTKSHNLNLYSPDELSSVRITTENNKSTFHGDNPIQFDSRVDIVDNVGTIIHQDLSAKLTQMVTDTRTAAGSNNTDEAQINLDAYISLNDSRVTANASGISAETSTRQTEVSNMQTNLTNSVNTSCTTIRTADDTTISDNISQEATDRANAITSIVTTRANAFTTLNTDLVTERGRIDAILASASVNLDTLAEISAAFAAADASIQYAVTSLQTQLTTIQDRMNSLVEQGFPDINAVTYTPDYAFDGSHLNTTDEDYGPGDALYDTYGIDQLDISDSFSPTIHFKDAESFNQWLNYTSPSPTRSVTYVSLNGSNYPWEGTWALTEYSQNYPFYIHYQSMTIALRTQLADHLASAGVGSSLVSIEFS